MKFTAIALILLFLVVSMTPMSHCATTSTQKHNNSLGVIQYESNPFTYIEGSISNVSLIENGDIPALNLRLQPKATYALFTEEILLCDAQDAVEKFQGKSGRVFVLTYETVSHRTVQGIGCHRLIFVDVIYDPTVAVDVVQGENNGH